MVVDQLGKTARLRLQKSLRTLGEDASEYGDYTLAASHADKDVRLLETGSQAEKDRVRQGSRSVLGPRTLTDPHGPTHGSTRTPTDSETKISLKALSECALTTHLASINLSDTPSNGH